MAGYRRLLRAHHLQGHVQPGAQAAAEAPPPGPRRSGATRGAAGRRLPGGPHARVEITRFRSMRRRCASRASIIAATTQRSESVSPSHPPKQGRVGVFDRQRDSFLLGGRHLGV